MALTEKEIMNALSQVKLPDGGDLISRNLVRALRIDGDQVYFVIEAANPDEAQKLAPVSSEAEKVVEALDGVRKALIVMTAHGPASQRPEPPQIGGHPKPQAGPARIEGVKKLIAVASGKGGVGKSTVSSNLAVALARQGNKVGLLDADILGPSQPRMMGMNQKPQSPDGKLLVPLEAHGVKFMSIGLLVPEGEALVWRGPMLMGALQQMLGQVLWGELDVLLVDLPPGTGDVQLTLSQKSELDGALIVSTPQDVALLDARKAISMFNKVNVPILGLIENMSTYICPECGNEDHIFGHGGVKDEAEKLGVPLLAELPLALDVRKAGDAGTPIAASEGPLADAYAKLAAELIGRGVV
ncbi:MAG TPA: iron-sulfur cluster carrier protein ApbC [Rhodobacteraceae bacterium]|nr:iron-sulfur cluster carrier protein ApbC [Paracoccaceae bacterium]